MVNERDEDERLTAEELGEEKKAAETKQMIREHVEAGWMWDDGTNMLTHPVDRDINMWIHPFSYEVLLSPKLVETLKRQVERERRGGKP